LAGEIEIFEGGLMEKRAKDTRRHGKVGDPLTLLATQVF
jgi:hypothetical protein